MLAGIVSIAWNRIHTMPASCAVLVWCVSFLSPPSALSPPHHLPRRNAPCIVSLSVPSPSVYGPLTLDLASTVHSRTLHLRVCVRVCVCVRG